jgi:hypothetical protein
MRLALALQQEELASGFMPEQQGSLDTEGLDEETKQSLELAWRLQEEERKRIDEQREAASRMQGEPDDEESIALAIRLQQEDDEQALRDALGVQEGEMDDQGSPSQFSYEQLMRLGETVGEVSRGACPEQITALRTCTVAEAQANKAIILGEQCSICRMEFEPDDELRILRCCHAEHAACVDQWLAVKKSCPTCMVDIVPSPSASNALCQPVAPSPQPPPSAALGTPPPFEQAVMTTPPAIVIAPRTPETAAA